MDDQLKAQLTTVESERMKVGFTGTREGMTDAQQIALSDVLDHLMPTEFHHGDCVGADEQAHGMAFETNGERVKRVAHPPTNERLRAFCEADEVREPKDYLPRNRDIVDETQMLIACPKTAVEDYESGTWYTVRYARRVGKPVYIILPNGVL